jgi:DNA-binding transcriptional ArsR family regulator
MGIDDVFAVIAERTRRDILESLRSEGKSVGQLVGELQVSQPTVSKHLKVLREAGLVSMRAQGQKRFYSLEPTPLLTVQDWLEAFSPERLAEAAPGRVDVPPEYPTPQGEPAAEPTPEPTPDSAVSAVEAEASASGPLAPAALAAPGGPPPAAADTTRQQQIGRTMGRAAERAADLISQLRRRKDHER